MNQLICLPRQQVAFLEECRKIKGCGSLEGEFYTRFIPIFKDFGCDMVCKKTVKYDLGNRT